MGVAYKGRRELMCFLCEHQWADPDFGFIRRLWNALKSTMFPEKIDGVSGWRPCPHCGAAILKNGGCANMRCTLCNQVFLWGTFRNTTMGVNEAHAPASAAQPQPQPQHGSARDPGWDNIHTVSGYFLFFL